MREISSTQTQQGIKTGENCILSEIMEVVYDTQSNRNLNFVLLGFTATYTVSCFTFSVPLEVHLPES